MITTTQNKQIKQIIKLKKSARERRKQELFLVEGIRMFTEIPEEYLTYGCGIGITSSYERDFRYDDTTGSSCTGEDDEIFFRRSSRTGKTIISGA